MRMPASTQRSKHFSIEEEVKVSRDVTTLPFLLAMPVALSLSHGQYIEKMSHLAYRVQCVEGPHIVKHNARAEIAS